MRDRQPSDRLYRWRAFTHWLNLALLAAGGVAAAAWDPSVLVALAPLELGLLWVIPDLPGFRARVDEQEAAAGIARERAYYAEQLWGLHPARPTFGQRLLGLFAERKAPDVDRRIVDVRAASYQDYREMRDIIRRLHELEKVRGGPIPQGDFRRFEQVINGYLRYTLAARCLRQALADSKEAELRAGLAEVTAQLRDAAPDLRAPLDERRRLYEMRLERIPKLRASLELFRARADAIVHQMRNVHGQVLADPGMDFNSFLEELIERQEIMADPIGTLAADAELQQLLRDAPSPTTPARPAAPAPAEDATAIRAAAQRAAQQAPAAPHRRR